MHDIEQSATLNRLKIGCFLKFDAKALWKVAGTLDSDERTEASGCREAEPSLEVRISFKRLIPRTAFDSCIAETTESLNRSGSVPTCFAMVSILKRPHAVCGCESALAPNEN